MPASILETQHLAIRHLNGDDSPFVLELLNEPAFIQYIGDRHVRTLKQASDYISHGPMRSYHEHGFGLWLTALKSDATPIGMCGLLKRDYLPDADIGFAFLARYRAQGFALEAAQAVMQYAFATLAMQRVVAIVQPDNTASLKLLSKLGMSNARLIKTAATEPELLLLECKCCSRMP